MVTFPLSDLIQWLQALSLVVGIVVPLVTLARVNHLTIEVNSRLTRLVGAEKEASLGQGHAEGFAEGLAVTPVEPKL